MKGYIVEPEPYEPVVESTLVGCRRCHTTWVQDIPHSSDVRVNGPLYLFNACDVCYDPETKTYKEKHKSCLEKLLGPSPSKVIAT